MRAGVTLYLDTEFNGFGGELISLALVSKDGDEWYEVNELKNTTINPWVQQHVMPVLGKEPMRGKLFKLSFHQFVMQFNDPEIICDWHADLQHFCSLLSGFDYGSSLDFPFRSRVLKTPPGMVMPSRVQHNALEDARGLAEYHLHLQREALKI